MRKEPNGDKYARCDRTRSQERPSPILNIYCYGPDQLLSSDHLPRTKELFLEIEFSSRPSEHRVCCVPFPVCIGVAQYISTYHQFGCIFTTYSVSSLAMSRSAIRSSELASKSEVWQDLTHGQLIATCVDHASVRPF